MNDAYHGTCQPLPDRDVVDRLIWLTTFVTVLSAFHSLSQEMARKDLEKLLGRPLNEDDWWVHEREVWSRENQRSWERFRARWQQRLTDDQKIRRYVWGSREDTGAEREGNAHAT